MNSRPTTNELAQLAAMLAATRPTADARELAAAALDLWATCAVKLLRPEPKPTAVEIAPGRRRDPWQDEQLRRLNASSCPLDKLLVELEPNKDSTDRTALYRHFLEDNQCDGPAKIAEQKKAGVAAPFAEFVRDFYPKWRKASIRAERVAAGSKGAEKREANKAAEAAEDSKQPKPRKSKRGA